MPDEKRPSDAMLAAFATIRTIRGLKPFPSWPYKEALSKDELIKAPHLAWKAFISIVGEALYDELSPVQQVAHLAYWYDAEIYNGGHLQYFRSGMVEYIPLTILALPLLDAEAQAAVLKEASDRARSRPELVDPNRSHSELARARPFDDIDRAYALCKPTLDKLLHRYLDEHLGDFILFKDDA